MIKKERNHGNLSRKRGSQLLGPHREALRLVHAQLEASQHAGQAFVFANGGPAERRPDVLVALEGQGYLTIHIATEPHGVEDDWLVLVSADGEPMGKSPLCHAAKDAVALSKELNAEPGCRIYVIPIILFMDEAPDNAVQAWAMNRNIATLHTPYGLVEGLLQVVQEHRRRIYNPPGARQIDRVMAHLSTEERPAAEIVSEPEGDPMPEASITARQVIIQRADAVYVYTTGAAATDGL